jgi:hypothetical protein
MIWCVKPGGYFDEESMDYDVHIPFVDDPCYRATPRELDDTISQAYPGGSLCGSVCMPHDTSVKEIGRLTPGPAHYPRMDQR